MQYWTALTLSLCGCISDAVVGDDVMMDDPTVLELEATAAKVFAYMDWKRKQCSCNKTHKTWLLLVPSDVWQRGGIVRAKWHNVQLDRHHVPLQ